MYIDIFFDIKDDVYPMDLSKIETLSSFLVGISTVTDVTLSFSALEVCVY